MVILSQAAEGIGSAEGAETSGVSPNNNPRLRAPGTPTDNVHPMYAIPVGVKR